jgi:hypothetical protein
MSCNNNEQLVSDVLQARRNWKLLRRGEGISTLKWLAGDYPSQLFIRMGRSHFGNRRVLNQFEGHKELTTKHRLVTNLQIYT